MSITDITVTKTVRKKPFYRYLTQYKTKRTYILIIYLTVIIYQWVGKMFLSPIGWKLFIAFIGIEN